MYFIYTADFDFELLVFDDRAKAEAEVERMSRLAAYDCTEIQVFYVERENLYSACEAQGI